MSMSLKKDIEDTWGPHSQQAMSYKSMLKRLEPERGASIGPGHIVKLTATYFLTRGIIIISAWVVFLALFLGVAAGALWYVSSEVESSSHIIRTR